MLVQQLRLVIQLPVLYHRVEDPDLLNADALGIEAVFISALGLTGALAISVVRVKSSAVPVTGASGSRSSWSTIIGDAEED